MKPTKWWIQSGIVYGVTALTGFALMWHAEDGNSVQAAWLMAGLSLVFFVGGAIKYYREKASLKRNAKSSRPLKFQSRKTMDRFNSTEDAPKWSKAYFEAGRRARIAGVDRGRAPSVADIGWHCHKSWLAGWNDTDMSLLAETVAMFIPPLFLFVVSFFIPQTWLSIGLLVGAGCVWGLYAMFTASSLLDKHKR